MEGLWCDAVLLDLILLSCMFDPHCDNQTQRRDANGSQSQRHPGSPPTLSNTRFRRGLRGFFLLLIHSFRNSSGVTALSGGMCCFKGQEEITSELPTTHPESLHSATRRAGYNGAHEWL